MRNTRRRVRYLAIVAVVLAGSMIPAFSQTAAPADEVRAGNAGSKEEVSLLKQQVAEQQKQIDLLRAAVNAMQQKLGEDVNSPRPASLQAPSLGQVASLVPMVPAQPAATASVVPLAVKPSVQNDPSGGQEHSPLSFRIGGADFTPGGFMDFTVFGRSTNVGSGIGTSFGAAPFSHTTAGSLSETRFSMQNSRVSLGVTSTFKGFDLKGYVEADFLGFTPPNVFVSSNSNSLRSRLYWLDARKGKFEFLGGQSWSLLTPNRTGLSPNPPDIFFSQDMDTNYQVGLTWARQAQFRLIYHPSGTVTAGISIENPQQLYGNATVPSALVAEGDNGSGSITNSNAANNPSTPNVAPDVIAKVALDPMVGSRHEHIEFAGLLTSTRVYDPTAKLHSTAEGGGFAANFNFELVKNLHAIVNTFYSDGGGRYIFGLAPNFIIDRDSNGVYHPSLVHADSAVAGAEYQVNEHTMFYGYWGGVYIGRNFGIDCFVQPIPAGSPTGTVAVCNSTPSSTPSYIGYGYPGSSNSQNKNIQEGTFGVIQTFWKSPHYGSLQLITQYSYLNRAPWVVASGSPKDAHLSMGYVDMRYTLP
ncbi:MAG TPA: hypothetical protein VGW33_14910 [Terriglobia bacterium]|nr:hypothetical protein [Terriglobia bacterium]